MWSDICIRAEDGYCCAMFTPCTDSRSWSLDNTANSMVDTNCDTDYVGFSSKNPSWHICFVFAKNVFSLMKIGVADTCTQSSNTILHSRLCGGIFSVTDGVTAAAIPSVCGKYSLFGSIQMSYNMIILSSRLFKTFHCGDRHGCHQ